MPQHYVLSFSVPRSEVFDPAEPSYALDAVWQRRDDLWLRLSVTWAFLAAYQLLNHSPPVVDCPQTIVVEDRHDGWLAAIGSQARFKICIVRMDITCFITYFWLAAAFVSSPSGTLQIGPLQAVPLEPSWRCLRSSGSGNVPTTCIKKYILKSTAACQHRQNEGKEL